MSLVDRWLSRSPQDERVATSATPPENPCISADFSVATNSRHAATLPRATCSSALMSRPVAAGLRHENPENSAAFEAMSHMSQMSRGSITKVAKPAKPIWWREFYKERAEHREFNDRHPRTEAERLPWGCAVTRRRFPVGASPTRRFAPAGSNRSSHGGNEMAEAFD